MTEPEKMVMDQLVAAWNAFVALPDSVAIEEFSRGIHDAQMAIALRVARRANPEIWRRSEQ